MRTTSSRLKVRGRPWTGVEQTGAPGQSYSPSLSLCPLHPCPATPHSPGLPAMPQPSPERHTKAGVKVSQPCAQPHCTITGLWALATSGLGGDSAPTPAQSPTERAGRGSLGPRGRHPSRLCPRSAQGIPHSGKATTCPSPWLPSPALRSGLYILRAAMP